MSNKQQAGTKLRQLLSATFMGGAKALLIFAIGIVILRFVLNRFAPLADSEAVSSLRGLPALLNLAVFQHMGQSTWSELFEKLAFTTLIVLVALCWSTAVTLILGYQLSRKTHALHWDALSNIFTFASGLPLFAVGLSLCFAFTKFPVLQPPDTSNWFIFHRVLVAGIILGSFEGALSEAQRSFRTIFTELQSRTYYLVYRANGRSTFDIAYRAIRPYFLRSLATRISYLFGGVIIVEKALDFKQLGLYFIERCFPGGSTDYHLYVQALCSGMLLVATPILIRMMLEIRLKFTTAP